MKTVYVVAWAVIAIMVVNLANVTINSGMHHGVGFDTFLAGMDDPWQVFINNDLVMGLVFMVAWILFREAGGRALDTAAWVWMTLWWGNIVVAVYVLCAARGSGGDWTRFFLGRRADGAGARPEVKPPLALRLACGLGAAAVGAYLVFGLQQAGFAPIPTFGYVAGFAPIILSLILLAFPARAKA